MFVASTGCRKILFQKDTMRQLTRRQKVTWGLGALILMATYYALVAIHGSTNYIADSAKGAFVVDNPETVHSHPDSHVQKIPKIQEELPFQNHSTKVATTETITHEEKNTLASTTNQTVSPTPVNSLEMAMEEVIRIFIRDPQKAEEYLRLYPLEKFRFFVYDLPKKLRWDTIVQCVEEKYKIFHEEHKHLDICPWMSRRCAQTNALGAYNGRRYNRNADAVIAQALVEYQGPLRTTDPEKAELFIVPFPASAYCMCNHMKGREKLCSRSVGPNWIENKLVPHLSPIYNATTNAHKHVFLNSLIRGPAQVSFDRVPGRPVVWTLDQKGKKKGSFDNTTFIIPYANLHPDYGPNHVPPGGDPSKVTKKYSLVSDINRITVVSGSLERQLFVEHARPYLEEHANMLGGMPVKVALPELANNSKTKDQANSNATSAAAVFDENGGLQRFQDAILCPTLRGDTPTQKRFFDALLSGCIPVLFKYSANDGKEITYAGEGEADNRAFYPFAQGTFPGMPRMGLNYSELVVELELGNISSAFSLLDELIRNKMDQVIRPKQKEIARSANLFTYGLGKDALLAPNTIVGLLVQTRHFLLFREKERIPVAELSR